MPKIPSSIGCPHCKGTFIQRSGFSKQKTTKCPRCGSMFSIWEARFFNISIGNMGVDITDKLRPILDIFKEKYGRKRTEPVFIEHIEPSVLTYSHEIESTNNIFERELNYLFSGKEEIDKMKAMII